MKRIIIYLIFLISFSNAIQCYNGKTYVDIPESKLSEVVYTKYNITHSSFDCKVAYNRYLKVKETEQVNVSDVIENEKNELEEPISLSSFLFGYIDYLDSLLPSYIGSFLLILVIVVFVIWLIKITVKEEQVKPENNDKSECQIKSKNDIKSEPVKSCDDLSREYSENLRKIEEERVKNGFYEIPKSKPAYTIIKNKPFNNSLDKTKTAYELLLERPEWKAYRLAVLAERGEKCEWCGSDKNLHVHHKFYLKYHNGKHILPWQYKTDALLVLCKDCHTKAHKQYKIKTYYTSY